jgi:hypothetical protein
MHQPPKIVLVGSAGGWRHDDFSLDQLRPETLEGFQVQEAFEESRTVCGRGFVRHGRHPIHLCSTLASSVQSTLR